MGPDVIHLEYGHHAGEVGLFCRFPRALRTLILEPFSAKYPSCRFGKVQPDTPSSPAIPTWYADLSLEPDLYPILRHSQFEDLLNGSFEDPIDGILKVVQPGQGIDVRVEIMIRSARRFRCRDAKSAVKKLDGPFFRKHFRLAGFYARRVTRPWASHHAPDFVLQ